MGIATIGASRHRIDRLLGPGAAVLLGAATGFFCFAMPARIVFPLISGLGLPPALAASRGPLALALGLLVAVATWAAFRWLDRPAARAPARSMADGAAPVLRRADVHPDAPARRPIFAGSDLGTPLDLIDPLPEDWQATAAEAPAWPAPAPVADITPAEPPAPETTAPEPAAAPPVTHARIELAPPAAAPREAALQPSLTALMGRLELSLARKALALDGGDTNVTPLKREIRPVAGSLSDAVETLHRRTAGRR